MPQPLIEANTLTKRYGKQLVLDDVSFVVSEGQKIALIGRNGAGKSTLLKLLSGVEEPDHGTVRLLPWTKLGVVEQHTPLPSSSTGLAFLEETTRKAPWEIYKQSRAFGLTEDHLGRVPSSLSGGYQMRLKLISLFLPDPNLLLLDEPVNYLDVQTLLLLEEVLRAFKGSYLITAHDRAFLRNTCTHTYEVERGSITMFPGGIDGYFAWKDEQREFALRTNKRLAREISHNQAFVDRFRAKASLASQAQSKLKHVQKLRTQLREIGPDLSSVRLHLTQPTIHPGRALAVRNLTIGYEGKEIASEISFEVERGEKVVIAGENGQGKSTLLKTIAGRLTPLSGEVSWYKQAEIGYFDQHTERQLLAGETVLAYLTRQAPAYTRPERLLQAAGSFLFRDDDHEKTTDVLSGGERARLCLAGLFLHEHSVLILDEPTNHLDVETSESLTKALQEYRGTVLFVSHARTFAGALATKIYEVGEGRVRHIPLSYDAYVDTLRDQLNLPTHTSTEESAAQKASDRARLKAGLQSTRKQVQQIEKQLKELEREKSEILAYYFENPTDYAPEKQTRLESLKEEIERLEQQWLKLQEED